MEIAVLDAKTLGDDLDLSVLKKFGKITVFDTTSRDERSEHIGNSKIIITNKVVIDRKIMEAKPSLKLIVVAATGYNNIDIEAAKEYKITVTNVKGYSTESVAQHTFAMLFSLLHNLLYYDNYVKSGRYSESEIFTHINRPFYILKNKTFGIIGLGNIGRKVGEIAENFGCGIIYYSTSGIERKEKYERVSLEQLLSSSDIVSIHSPLNNNTKNLINRNNIGFMKNTAILLNLGRGGIVNENDVKEAINKNDICCYGTDVLSKEPITKDNPLNFVKDKSRILITPHVAWTSIESRKELLKGIVNNIESFLNGSPENVII